MSIFVMHTDPDLLFIIFYLCISKWLQVKLSIAIDYSLSRLD